jgi:regulator of CtrA degradation
MNDAQFLEPQSQEGAISFARGFVRSEAFMTLFREGMGLVEQTAAYLDGEGRKESAALPREVALTYATESMRLTTRLMQIASWLLVQRAVAEGEMTAEQARAEHSKVKIGDPMIPPAEHIVARLPERLRGLMAHSVRLQARIRHLEEQMSGNAPLPANANPVQEQLASLQARLGLGR